MKNITKKIAKFIFSFGGMLVLFYEIICFLISWGYGFRPVTIVIFTICIIGDWCRGIYNMTEKGSRDENELFEFLYKTCCETIGVTLFFYTVKLFVFILSRIGTVDYIDFKFMEIITVTPFIVCGYLIKIRLEKGNLNFIMATTRDKINKLGS